VVGVVSARWRLARFLLLRVLRKNHTHGCQIFLDTKYQNGEKYTKWPQNIPNSHKIFPVAIK
jgi:hypothetical protein